MKLKASPFSKRVWFPNFGSKAQGRIFLVLEKNTNLPFHSLLYSHEGVQIQVKGFNISLRQTVG